MKSSMLAMMLLSAAAQAADTVTINVSGTLTRPPCVLSTNTNLTAEFGNVRTDLVNATETLTVPVRMSCPSGSSLNVSFRADKGTQTPTVAKTSATNLGVSLLWADDIPANLAGVVRAFTNLNGSVDISLKAKLVGFGTLTPGEFNSSIVMTIDYL